MSSASPISSDDSGPDASSDFVAKQAIQTTEHVLEIVSDSGEGAQKCGQIFASVSAKMSYGVWTVEIIPAEIEPPARTPAGASGNLIRFGRDKITNWGDEANLVVAFNEQVLLARHRLDALAGDCIILPDTGRVPKGGLGA